MDRLSPVSHLKNPSNFKARGRNRTGDPQFTKLSERGLWTGFSLFTVVYRFPSLPSEPLEWG